MTFHTQRGNCSNIKTEICCHILGEKHLQNGLAFRKEKEKKTLESDSSYQLLNELGTEKCYTMASATSLFVGCAHITHTLEFAITTSQTSFIGFVWHLLFYCHEMCLHCFFTVRSPVNTAP